MAIDPQDFRIALGCFTTGITIVTTLTDQKEPVGVTASSFNWVSVDPPLILFSLDRNSQSLAHFERATHFAVSVLRRGQEQLSDTFARRGADKWKGVDVETWETGCPVIPGALASFECMVEARRDGGDHIIFVGRVGQLTYADEGSPLLFFRGRYTGLAHPGD
jgi:flavin reductase (DIM6/NTAB) family NADH-FMN oxidoreductase RutF